MQVWATSWEAKMTRESDEALRAELGEVLDGLVSTCSLKTTAVVTRDGSLVTVRGDTSYLDSTALAALLGGMFSATREVARMVGEEHFSILLQQGEKRHIHISLVSNAFMLACIFEDVAKIGMLRIHTGRIAARVGELAGAGWLPAASTQTQTLASGDPPPASKQGAEFREYALDLIDRIFAG